MFIQQLYTNCLAEAAYYIESEGEAVIIDPLRETEPYLSLAAQRGAKIKYIFETHFHADFISGHIDLSNLTGAPIIFGPGAITKYKIYSAKDKETFSIGKLYLEVLYTPGHTPESSCFLLYDEDNNPYAVFTGDTLFVGDVGRPDLLDEKITKEEMAAALFDSLNNKIKPLPDYVIIYPAHGSGSSCGKNIGKEKFSTMGLQKKSNYALQETDKDQFIQKLLSGILPPPQYFANDALINKNGYTPLDIVMKNNLIPLDIDTFKEKTLIENVLILDTRSAEIFEEGFIPGSLNFGLDGQYAIWVGTLVDINQPLLLVCEPGREEEAILRLARIGYENVLGYLNGGFDTWVKNNQEEDEVHSIEADEINRLMLDNPDAILIDVRKASEYADSHIAGATLVSLADMPARRHDFEPDKKYLVYCGGGYRSMIAISLLKVFGIDKLTNVHGGFSAIEKVEDIHLDKGARAAY